MKAFYRVAEWAMYLGLIGMLISLAPVFHAVLGEGLVLSANEWRYTAMLGILGAGTFLLGITISLVGIGSRSR
jgi:hypothetical protein